MTASDAPISPRLIPSARLPLAIQVTMRLIGLAVTLAVSLTLAPVAAEAQPTEKAHRICRVTRCPLHAEPVALVGERSIPSCRTWPASLGRRPQSPPHQEMRDNEQNDCNEEQHEQIPISRLLRGAEVRGHAL